MKCQPVCQFLLSCMNQANSCRASPELGQINLARTEPTLYASARASLQHAWQPDLEVLEQTPCRGSLSLWLGSYHSMSPKATPGQELPCGTDPARCSAGSVGSAWVSARPGHPSSSMRRAECKLCLTLHGTGTFCSAD